MAERWKQSTRTCESDYTADARQKMFHSCQTYERLVISVNSHIDAIKFLLLEGFKYVLTERFMQDVLEDYFGHQRDKGRRSDIPTAQQFGYNDLTIGGWYEKVNSYQVSDEPVQKRRKK